MKFTPSPSKVPMSLKNSMDMLSPKESLRAGKNPSLVVFDLDFTIWPFDCDKDVIAPFIPCGAGVVDSRFCRADPYPNVQEIIATLVDAGIPIAYASRNPSAASIQSLLSAITIPSEKEMTLWSALPSSDYFHAYSSCGRKGKSLHFEAIKKASGVEYSDMLFFDDLIENIESARQQGIPSMYLSYKRGLSWQSFLEGLAMWRDKHP
jgi:magnesium-dependent phosphatase 1